MILSICITSLIYQVMALTTLVWVYYDNYVNAGLTIIPAIGIFVTPAQIALLIITFYQTKKEISNA